MFNPQPKPEKKPKKKKGKKPFVDKRVEYRGVLMPKHTAVYYGYFNLDPSDTIYCEICGAVAVDTMHIKPRGLGSTKLLDIPENTMAGCRKDHEFYGDKPEYFDFLVEIHAKKMGLPPETVKDRILKAKYK